MDRVTLDGEINNFGVMCVCGVCVLCVCCVCGVFFINFISQHVPLQKAILHARDCLYVIYVGRSSCKVSSFFFSGMEADRNVKVVGGDVAVL